MTLTGTEHCGNQRKWKTHKRSITHSRKKCYPYRIFAFGIFYFVWKEIFEETFIIAGSVTLRKGNGNADQTIIAYSSRSQLRSAVGGGSVHGAGGGGTDPQIRRENAHGPLCIAV